MVKTTAEIKSIVAHYVRELKARGIHVEKVVLFGSYGRGTATEGSDIDLAFISEDFDQYNLLKRQQILSACRPGLAPTDVIAYSPRMMIQKRDSSPLIQQILSDGQDIFSTAA